MPASRCPASHSHPRVWHHPRARDIMARPRRAPIFRPPISSTHRLRSPARPHADSLVRQRPRPPARRLAVVSLLSVAASQSQTTRLAGGPEPVDVRMEPAVLRSGQEAMVVVRSPSADSIAIESENGVDRYWSAGPRLRARLSADFGDPSAGPPATPSGGTGVLLDRLQEAGHHLGLQAGALPGVLPRVRGAPAGAQPADRGAHRRVEHDVRPADHDRPRTGPRCSRRR